MIEILRPGISEAVKEFWAHIARRTPPPILDKEYVNQALLLALAKLNLARDKGEDHGKIG